MAEPRIWRARAPTPQSAQLRPQSRTEPRAHSLASARFWSVSDGQRTEPRAHSQCEVLERLQRPVWQNHWQGSRGLRGLRGLKPASMAEKTFLSFLAHILAPNTCRRHGFSPSNSSPKRASHGRTFDAKRPLNPYNKRLFFPLLPRAHSLASARFWSVSNGQSGRTIGKVRGV